MSTAFILYDHSLFARGLERLLMQEGVKVVGVSAKAKHPLAQIRRLKPDVIIDEVEKKEPEGEIFLSRLLKEQPQAKVVRVSLEDKTAVLYSGQRWTANSIEDLMKGIFGGMLPGCNRVDQKIAAGARLK